jgi:1-phosphatidylinositol-4-phosphate 5-kinase
MLAVFLIVTTDIRCTFLFYVRFFLCRQIEIDSKFLEAQQIMDYSLLLGVHYRAPQHLRSHLFYQSITADGLAMLAEEGMAYVKLVIQHNLFMKF